METNEEANSQSSELDKEEASLLRWMRPRRPRGSQSGAGEMARRKFARPPTDCPWVPEDTLDVSSLPSPNAKRICTLPRVLSTK